MRDMDGVFDELGVGCSSLERGVLMVHACLLDAGYRLKRAHSLDAHGNVHQLVLPHNWKRLAPKYAFEYEDGVDMQALITGTEVHIHVSSGDSSSFGTAELVSTILRKDEAALWSSTIRNHVMKKLGADIEYPETPRAKTTASDDTPRYAASTSDDEFPLNDRCDYCGSHLA